METYTHESQLYTGIIPLLCQLSRNLNFMSQWSDETAAHFGKAMKSRRSELELSVRDLEDRTREIGHLVSRSTISGIENGSKKTIHLQDALVLSECLRMPLGYMLYPGAPDGSVEATPGRDMRAYDAIHAMSGDFIPIADEELGETDEDGNRPPKTRRAAEARTGYLLPQLIHELEAARDHADEIDQRVTDTLKIVVSRLGGEVRND